MTTIDRRTALKLLGAGTLFIGSTRTVAAQEAPAPGVELAVEFEGPLGAVDTANNVITVMGVPIDVSNAAFSTPTATLASAEELLGAALPGRSDPGFVGGTAIVIGRVTVFETTPPTASMVVADDVFVEAAENVMVGAVTSNDIPEGGSFGDGSFTVQGVEVRPVNDPRLPLVSGVEGLAIDASTIPAGTLAAVEGHFGSDGTLYVHTIEASEAEFTEAFQTSITRISCEDGGRLEIRGASTTPSETITFYNDETNEVLGTAFAAEDPEAGGIGVYRFRQDVASCPLTVRAENTNGSSTTASLGAAEPPAPEQQVITIESTGGPARYDLTVEGSLEKSEAFGGTINDNDTVAADGTSASGSVNNGGRDSYLVTGEAELLEVSAPVNVYVDGTQIQRGAQDFYPNVITIEATGVASQYSFDVTGTVEHSESFGGTVQANDVITGTSVSGRVAGSGRDSYAYTGDITGFQSNSPVNLYRNGEPVTL